MEIRERREGAFTVLSPAGRIDNDSSAVFQQKLLGCIAAAAARVVVDLSEVEFISSAGLGALMTAAKQAKAAQARIAVAALRPVVQEIFTISRFGHVVPVYGTPADAMAALQ